MDDAERRLRESLASAVDGWSPEPMPLVRRSSPGSTPVRVGLAVAIVVLLAAGGTGLGLSLSGSKTRSSLAAAPLPTPSGSPVPAASLSPCPASLTPSPIATASVVPLPGITSAYASTICFAFDQPAPTAAVATASAPATEVVALGPGPKPSPSTSPSPTMSPSAVAVPTCAKNNFTVDVRTDATSYSSKVPVEIDVSVTSKKTCDSYVDYVIEGTVTTGGRIVEEFGSYCPLHDGVDPKCPFAHNEVARGLLRHWKAGETESAMDTWNQAVGQSQAGPTYADPGSYDVTVTAGDVGGSGHFAITAPMCTPDQLTVTLTSDASTYAQGQVAKLTGVVTNTSGVACEAPLGDVIDPFAVDDSGTKVWTDCQGTGDTEQTDGSCLNDLTARAGTTLVAPGAALDPGGETFTWNLGQTGSTASNPKPLAAGSYTISWPGLTGTALTPATVTVTITG